VAWPHEWLTASQRALVDSGARDVDTAASIIPVMSSRRTLDGTLQNVE